ncbi:hypothetical protein DSO57_1036973 [Entomophthora muscae]|uniref:Uncharacterized protein n=1 Tax=Entomophthora muscae TaxID=34485 RepID=A0ACC2RQA0_9FUNG|nr:hypothetical protein DSO57_1036973 [Entomophthora muscae]
MQAKYKLLINPSPLLENDNSSKPVPGYNPGHTMGTGDQDPQGLFLEDNTKQHFPIVAINFATHWPICWATKDHEAETINCFINKAIVDNYGTSDYIITN